MSSYGQNPSANDQPEFQQSRAFRHEPYAKAFLLLVVLYITFTCSALTLIPSLSRKDVFLFGSSSHDFSSNARFLLRHQPLRQGTMRKSSNPRIQELQGAFPVHVNDDNEEIDHPGILFAGKERLEALLPGFDFPLTFQVPRFWSPSAYGEAGVRGFLGNGGNRVLTKEEAQSIGSTHHGQETIFVSLASYRDPECLLTVESIYLRAKHPDRIRVAIVDQVEPEDHKCSHPPVPCDQDGDQVICKYRHLIDSMEVPAYLMVGPVFARHLAHRMYRGEHFAMQVDAHVRFTQDWDEDLVGQWRSSNNEMAVISTYLTDITDSIDPVTHESRQDTRNMMCLIQYEGNGSSKHLFLKAPLKRAPAVQGTPMLHPYWSAGFSFSRGHFVVQVPYDQYLPMVFQGEESSIAVRGFTYGYDFYAPERSVAFHIYAIKDHISRRNRHKFWENETLYSGALQKSLARLNGIIGANGESTRQKFFDKDMNKYGVGGVRPKDSYYRTFGIHTDTQTVDDHLCEFVEEPMHRTFAPYLREDGMGIDYGKINYVFEDSQPRLG